MLLVKKTPIVLITRPFGVFWAESAAKVRIALHRRVNSGLSPINGDGLAHPAKRPKAP